MRCGDEFCRNALASHSVARRGTNAPRNIAESTGKFPPTPIDHTDANEISVIELGEPPAAKANMATMRSVMLKDIL